MSKAPKTARVKLVTAEDDNRLYSAGKTIPQTGLYQVSHSQHQVPREVTLRRGESFPPCSACSEPVAFRLLRAAPAEIDDRYFKVVLYSLPVLESPAIEDEEEPLAG